MSDKIRNNKIESKAFIGPTYRYFKHNGGILAVLLVICILLSFIAPNFATVNNWLTILRNVSTTGFLAIGVTLAIM